MGDYDDRPDWRELDRRRDKSKLYGRIEEKGQKKEKAERSLPDWEGKRSP